MKIIHICLTGPYTFGWGYQENILPKYHQQLGHEVIVIATCYTHTSNGKIIKTKAGRFIDNGVNIVRVDYNPVFRKLNSLLNFYNVYSYLIKEKPDFVMIHGLVTFSALCVAKYKRRVNNNLIIVADTHADFYNSKSSGGIKFAMFITLFRLLNRYMIHYYRNVYAMTPECIRFAHEVYDVPQQKIQLLPLGVDDRLMQGLDESRCRASIRDKYGFSRESIIVTTGGKLTYEKNVHLVIEAFAKISNHNTKLLIFGDFADKEYENLLKKKTLDNVHFTGQLSLIEIYSVLLASDVVVFPGTQSVLWQQAIAAGKPLIVKSWPGIEYLDFGGNLKIIKTIEENSLYDSIYTITNSMNKMQEMGRIAREIGFKRLSYSHIATIIINNSSWEDLVC